MELILGLFGLAIGVGFGAQQWLSGRRTARQLARVEELLTRRALDDPRFVQTAIRRSGVAIGTAEETDTAMPIAPVTSRQLDLRNRLAHAISQLSEREKLVVTLDFYEGLTTAEIAETLGITESTVNRIRRHALDKLGSEFDPPPPASNRRPE
jgi:RNA polymerase sigma factor (sigma-70 family)